MNCVGYVRVSTERQAGEVLTSLSDQEAAIRQLAARLSLDVGQWFRDEGASGATVAKRPAFRAMLDHCQSHERSPNDLGTVLVLNDSRFGRFPDPEEAAYWRHHLRRLGWIVRFVEGDEIENSTARTLMRAIGSAQATEYRDNLIRNTKRGMKGAASQGFWTREAPFGYRRQVVYPVAGRVLDVGEVKTDKEKVKLTPHEEEAALVRWAYEAYASGEHSGTSLARELKRRVPSRKWSTQVVHAMLRNPAYMGDVVSGRRVGQEDYGCRDAHPALVSRELWHAAQARMEKNRLRGKAVNAEYLLSGILHCPLCGDTYAGGGYGGKARKGDDTQSRPRIYRDSGGVAGNCPGRIGTVMRHIVEDATLDTLTETLSAPAVQRQIEQAIDRALSGSDADAGESKRQLEAARRKANERRDRLVAAVADGTLLRDEAGPRLEALRSELANLDSRLEQLRFHDRRAKANVEDRNRLVRMAKEFPRVVSALRAAGRGKALREYVEPWLELATFDKLSRVLTLHIRPAPTLLLAISPGPNSR
jgi:DNA invertase Pin-like site-specific DNA recombinase